MAFTPDYDLIIVGGGPAGSTLGTLVRKYNPSSKVLILDRARFPRHHVGESLLPSSVPVLKEMGAFEKVDRAGFPRKVGVTYIWGENREPWNADFSTLPVETFFERNQVPPGDLPFAWQILRSKYDSILLDHARSVGV